MSSRKTILWIRPAPSWISGPQSQCLLHFSILFPSEHTSVSNLTDLGLVSERPTPSTSSGCKLHKSCFANTVQYPVPHTPSKEYVLTDWWDLWTHLSQCVCPQKNFSYYFEAPESHTYVRTSLEIQWLRTPLPMQGTWAPSLVGELKSFLPRGNKSHVPQLTCQPTATKILRAVAKIQRN